ncbi:unknown [Leishmania donovani]|nr:unknown [Leishmania donovani]
MQRLGAAEGGAWRAGGAQSLGGPWPGAGQLPPWVHSACAFAIPCHHPRDRRYRHCPRAGRWTRPAWIKACGPLGCPRGADHGARARGRGGSRTRGAR